MTAQIIEAKRQPPLWKVKSGKRIRAVFSGVSARSQAEAYATENHGSFEVKAKQPTGKQVKRAEKLAEIAEKETVMCKERLSMMSSSGYSPKLSSLGPDRRQQSGAN